MSTAERIRVMLSNGDSIETICAKLGVTRQRVLMVRWHMNNPGKKAAYARSYWHRNKEQIKARENERMRAHKERLREQRKKLQDRIKKLEIELRELKRAQKPPKPIQGPAHWYW